MKPVWRRWIKAPDVEDLVRLEVRERIGRFKYVAAEHMQEEYEAITRDLNNEISGKVPKEGDY